MELVKINSANNNRFVHCSEGLADKLILDNLLIHNVVPDFRAHYIDMEVPADISFFRSELPYRKGLDFGITKEFENNPLFGQIAYVLLYALQSSYAANSQCSIEGSVIFQDERGILLIGGSGAGKTTTSHQLYFQKNFGWAGDNAILLGLDEKGLTFCGGNRISAIDCEFFKILLGDMDIEFINHPSKSHKNYIDMGDLSKFFGRRIDLIAYISISELAKTRKLDSNHAIDGLYTVLSQQIGFNTCTWLDTNEVLEPQDTHYLQNDRLQKVIKLVRNNEVESYEVRGSIRTLPEQIADLIGY